ncbi:FmdB family zinc ribbon protein [Pedococcus sp.]|uniref:FmdB family zinc ribbon protein n=1 Tax=Pedococcus sp. TaxID=2860345 RepID=UPI002E0ECF7A|nr:FmdB family zinc ribbon protein [Pedococcus sp.]
MPTYSYACTACDHRFDAVQSFSDESLTVCPECGGRLRKVFNAVGVVFKGGGFYRTDSRSGSSASVPAASSDSSSSSGSSASSSSAGTAAASGSTSGSASSKGTKDGSSAA